ncbi:DUF5689 domain-containing protein [Aestuariibaculum sediminum]|uniref:Choice-of-anchor J domain-containing protein n=1 Tax=Aestuariibaculum sediminum TaxID=2770637 RepID=A0A8J6PYI3_9FLAO|nr:DUF5689 domain-containing protein [Aestuariibaculum sediminum]MBD0831038.1 choice-of-anchor J domain-containing protein [Aestuariibaculum sediminum]
MNSVLKKKLQFLGLMFMLLSCVENDDYAIPKIELDEPNITANTTISIIKNMYNGSLINFNEANNEGELIIEGYVVSNDEAGNFYKVLIIQDKAENPTAAIQIDIDVTALFALYKPGQKIYVKLNGLGMDEQNGVLHIGALHGGSVTRISAFNYKKHIKRSPILDSIIPKIITPSEFNDSYINMLIQLDNMQLRNEELGQPYGYANNSYTANRYLQNCEDNSFIILRNSGFSDFKNQLFPEGQGTIVGVLSKYNNDFQLFIRDTEDVKFYDERCETSVYMPIDPFNLPYTQNFEGDYIKGQSLRIDGWYTVNTSGGTKVFTLENVNNNLVAQAQAYGSGETIMETWLISPGIRIDAASKNPVLSFTSNDGYNNGDPLTVYISNNFSGVIDEASWNEISPFLSTGNSSGFGAEFKFSGEIDLSEYIGEVIYVGFKYSGGTNGITTTIQLDDFYVGEAINIKSEGPSENAVLVFPGGDFEDYNTFLAGLNSEGIQDYASQSAGNGLAESTGLNIKTGGATGNDYVFTAVGHGSLTDTYNTIHFYLKGTSNKSISINLYKTDGAYYRFNLGDVSDDKTIKASSSNQYGGVINTNEEWVLITLDLSEITDLNLTNTNSDFFALKIGKESTYNLYLDNFTIE